MQGLCTLQESQQPQQHSDCTLHLHMSLFQKHTCDLTILGLPLTSHCFSFWSDNHCAGKCSGVQGECKASQKGAASLVRVWAPLQLPRWPQLQSSCNSNGGSLTIHVCTACGSASALFACPHGCNCIQVAIAMVMVRPHCLYSLHVHLHWC